jgi:acyl carrier protein
MIRDFVRTKTNDAELDDRSDIFDTGYVSSMFAVQALTWTERTFNLEITSEDLMMDNFRSIEAIARFVETKETTSIS